MLNSEAVAVSSAPNAFDRISIRAKLIAAFGILLALLLGLGAFAVERVDRVRGVAVDLETNWLPSVRELGSINVVAGDHRFNVALHVLNTDSAELQRIEERLTSWAVRLAELRRSYEPLIASPEEQRLYDSFARFWDTYLREVEVALAASRRNEKPTATTILQQRVVPAYRAVRDSAQKLTQLNVDGGTAAGLAGSAAYDLTLKLVLGLIATAILLGVGIAWLYGQKHRSRYHRGRRADASHGPGEA